MVWCAGHGGCCVVVGRGGVCCVCRVCWCWLFGDGGDDYNVISNAVVVFVVCVGVGCLVMLVMVIMLLVFVMLLLWLAGVVISSPPFFFLYLFHISSLIFVLYVTFCFFQHHEVCCLL